MQVNTNESTIVKLAEHIHARFGNLNQSVLVNNPAKNSGYESDLASRLGMDEPPKDMRRICDAIWSQIKYPIEFKKGNIWVDAVRVAQQALNTPFREVIWIHFAISKSAKRVNRITAFKLSRFIEMIGLNDPVQAKSVIALYDFARSRGCNNNNQWSTTPDNIEDIAEFVIRHSDYNRKTEVPSASPYDFVPLVETKTITT